MPNNFKTKLPQNLSELQAVIRSSIEYVTKNPYSNKNKLNEALSVGLGVRNFNALKPQLNKISPISAEFINGETIINGQTINNDVYQDALTDFYVVPREDEIHWIIEYVSDGVTLTGNNLQLAKNDLSLLASLPDEYILKSHNTNKYLSPTKDTEEFNEECNKMLIASKLKPVNFKVTQEKTDIETLADLIQSSPTLIKSENIFIHSSYMLNKILVISWFNEEGDDYYYELDTNVDSFQRNGNGSFTLKSEKYGDKEIVLMSPMNI